MEQYLIKAECLARKSQLTDAMDVLNEVRKTYILPEKYQPLSVSAEAEAIQYIRQAKDNQLIFSIVPFGDARRYNAEGTYARTLTKEIDGKQIVLLHPLISGPSHSLREPLKILATEVSFRM